MLSPQDRKLCAALVTAESGRNAPPCLAPFRSRCATVCQQVMTWHCLTGINMVSHQYFHRSSCTCMPQGHLSLYIFTGTELKSAWFRWASFRPWNLGIQPDFQAVSTLWHTNVGPLHDKLRWNAVIGQANAEAITYQEAVIVIIFFLYA